MEKRTLSAFNIRLAQLRKDNRLKQHEVADAVGIKRTTYTCYEIGNSMPSVETLCAIADFFQVTLDYLVGRGETKEFCHVVDPKRARRENELVTSFRSMDDRQQIALCKMISTFSLTFSET